MSYKKHKRQPPGAVDLGTASPDSRAEGGGKRKGFNAPGRLDLASFGCGAAVMVLEMTGSRLVAPFFGTSLIVWTALIGIIMTSLCFGNWLGGYLSDRRPEARILGRILLASAFTTAALAFFGNAVLAGLASLHLNLYVASVVAALLLFTPSSLLLGMVSPFIVRLAMRDVDSSGGTVGRFSAIGSAGSIFGTFLGGFVLISLFPSGIILMLLASFLALLSVAVYTAAWRGILVVAVCMLGGAGAAQVWGLPMTPIGVQIDTAYNHISIVESRMRDGRRIRILMTDPLGAQSAMFTDSPTDLVSDYTKFYDLAFHFKPDVKKILMLGGGAYCVPRHILSERNVSFDVVELDPGVTEAARQYFWLKDGPNLRIFHEDARTFLNRAARDGLGPYDAIFMDVFGSWYSIPFQMTTVETARRAYDLLAPDGVLISNVIAALNGQRSGVFHGIYSAFEQSFPRLMIFLASAPEDDRALQNIMLVGLRSEAFPDLPPAPEEPFARLLNHQWRGSFSSTVPPFTDAFAPVELYSLRQ